MSANTFEEILADPANRPAPITTLPTKPKKAPGLRIVQPEAPVTPGGAAAIDAVNAAPKPKKERAAAAAPPESATQLCVGHENHTCFAFRVHARNRFYACMFDRVTGDYVPSLAPAEIDTKGIKHIYALKNMPPPEIADIPAGEFVFEPGNKHPIQKLPSGLMVVNGWVEPPMRKLAIPTTECPKGIRALLLHVMGDDVVSFERFLNWLAHIYQTNQRANTSWVWSGVYGTGKQLVMDEVIAPLFGPNYCPTKFASALKDTFDAWVEQCVILNIDECVFSGPEARAMEAKLRMYTTSNTLSIRPMRTDSYMVPNRMSVIMTSNETVVAHIQRGDRRINVSPAQKVQLAAKYPDTDAIVAKIQRELPAFAGFLAQYKVDAQKVRQALVNDAKAEMIEAGQTGPEEFARALVEGDLDYLTTAYLDIAQMPAPRDAEKQLNREMFREAVTGWLDSFKPDTDIAIPTATACCIYNALFQPLTVDAVGRFLGKHNVQGKKNQLGLRGRSYRVRWQAPKDIEADRAALKAARNGKFSTTEETTCTTDTENGSN